MKCPKCESAMLRYGPFGEVEREWWRFVCPHCHTPQSEPIRVIEVLTEPVSTEAGDGAMVDQVKLTIRMGDHHEFVFLSSGDTMRLAFNLTAYSAPGEIGVTRIEDKT